MAHAALMSPATRIDLVLIRPVIATVNADMDGDTANVRVVVRDGESFVSDPETVIACADGVDGNCDSD
nr:hypothetical protein BaRGS_028397 [Batillaria attramentaria]